MFSSLPNKTGKFSVLPRDKQKVEQLVESSINLTSSQLSTLPIMTIKNPHLDSDKKSILLESLGSRGSAMLKAALIAKSGQNISNSVDRNCYSISEEQKKLMLLKHAKELKNRRRSPKNKVLFTEPLVTSHHEYEQTFIVDNEQEQRGINDQSASDQILGNDKFELDGEIFYEDCCKKFSGHSNSLDKPDKRLNKTNLLASSEQKSNPCYRKGRKKRSYDVAMKSDGEACEDFTSQTSSSDGSLFSSPKVAKIAPYYDNHTDNGKQVVSKQESADRKTTTNDNHIYSSGTVPHRSQRTKASKLLLPHEPRSSKPKSTWLVEPESKKVGTELLSVKKVSTDHQYDENSSTSGNPRPQESYLSWLSNGLSYLSNQMNKLIF